MQKAKWIAAAVAAGLLLVLMLQNTAPVETRVLFFSFVMPRAILLFTTAILGCLCGIVITLIALKKSQ